MSYIFDNERPIYLQVLEQLKIDIISRKYESGTRLPSVRELAVFFKINPNTITMQKALQELEEKNLFIQRELMVNLLPVM